MRRALWAIAMAGLVAGCRAAAPPGAAPAMLFDSRVPVAPLEAALDEERWRPGAHSPPGHGRRPDDAPSGRALQVRGARRRHAGHRPAAGQRARQRLLAPDPGRRRPGADGRRPRRRAYRPVADQGRCRSGQPGVLSERGSLEAAATSLVALGVDPSLIRVENRPPACVAAGASGPMMAGGTNGLRYGPLMVEVARRFEVIGKAFLARRFDLADFEVGEMGEIFVDDLPRASRRPRARASTSPASSRPSRRRTCPTSSRPSPRTTPRPSTPRSSAPRPRATGATRSAATRSSRCPSSRAAPCRERIRSRGRAGCPPAGPKAGLTASAFRASASPP